MSKLYQGGNAIPILSSTNASPIQITTSVVHGMATNDIIEIAGHTTNTRANGAWQITKVDNSNFTLNGSTGNGVGGATGVAIDFTGKFPFPAGTIPGVVGGITIPSPGDARQAASVNVGFQGVQDEVTYLRSRAHYSVFDFVLGAGTDNETGTAWSNSWSNNTYPTTTGSGANLLSFITNTNVNTVSGDFVEVELTGCIGYTGANLKNVFLALFSAYGTPAGSYAKILNSGIVATNLGNGQVLPFHLHGLIGTTAGNGGQFSFAVGGRINSGSTDSFALVDSYTSSCRIWRPL